MSPRRLFVTLLSLLLFLIALPQANAQVYDPETTLYAIQENFWTVNKLSGNSQEIGSPGTSFVLTGLACSERIDKLYAVDATTGITSFLFEVNAQTGDADPIGDTGFIGIEGLAYDADNDVLYGITNVNELLILNTVTGTAIKIDRTGLSFVDSLAYNSQEDQLYAVNRTSNSEVLYRIDPQTAKSQEVGTIGFEFVSGLAYDAKTDTLYGTSRASSELIIIDMNTGAGTTVGSVPSNSFSGLADCTAIDGTVFLPMVFKQSPVP